MTSTSFNVGLGDGSRLSSRVLRPPGGGHTDIFGGEAEPPRGRRMAPSAAANLIQGQSNEPAQPTNGDIPTQNGQASEPAPTVQAEPAAPQSTPEPRSPEPSTPDSASASVSASASPKAVTPTERGGSDAPKRVRVPPGGFSSGLW